MTHPPKQPLRRLGIGMAMLLAGGLCGAAARSAFREKETATLSPSIPPSRESRSVSTGESPSTGDSRRTRRGADPQRVTFSRQQWSTLIASPRAFRLKWQDCYPGGEKDPDHPTQGIHVSRWRGPELVPHVPFFGFSESERDQLRDALFDHGRALTEILGKAERSEYLGEGKMKLSHAAEAADQFSRARQDLSRRLERILGEKDAARFGAVIGLDVPEMKEASLTLVRTETGYEGAINGFSDFKWDLVPKNDPGEIETEWTRHAMLYLAGFTQTEVDWSRLTREADAAGIPPPTPEAE